MSGTKRRGIGMAVAVVIVIIVIGLVAGAYYVLSSSGGSTIKTVTVTVPNGTGTNTSLNFSPSTIVVVMGVNNTVEWVNQDSVGHTVTSTSVPTGANTFNSPLPAGGTVTVTFTTAGTYQYECSIHPSYMKGTVIVKSG